jgi:hypothetical protein
MVIHSLVTAPNVRPAMMYFCSITTVINVGSSATMETAAILPYLIPTVVTNCRSPTVIVLDLSAVSTDAKRYSFQLKIKTSIEAAAIEGAATGKMMCLKSCDIPTPSTRAASSIALGIPSIPDFTSQIARGRLNKE